MDWLRLRRGIMALCVLATACAARPEAVDWSGVERVLAEELANQTFPGAVALVALTGQGSAGGAPAAPALLRAVGRHSYDAGSVPVRASTAFDMASLTKVLSTTTAVMWLYQRGFLALETRVADATLLGPSFAAHGKGAITVRNLLLHNAGFPPDPTPNFWEPAFGCEQTGARPQPRLTFDCVPAILRGVCSQSLLNPVGAKFVYSDLSMITMMFVVGRVVHDHGLVPRAALRADCMAAAPVPAPVPAPARTRVRHAARAWQPWQAQCYYEAFVRTHIFESSGMVDSGFLPTGARAAGAAPACVATSYRPCPMTGAVSDGNAYAAGGVNGHAGLFSTAPDVHLLLARLTGAGAADGFINSSTVAAFTAVQNETQSSRALGWDTNSYAANTYRGCGNLSQATFTHTGYTGTQVCCDTARGLCTVLLTNRCFPDDSPASKAAVHRARQRFNNAVMDAVDRAAAKAE